VQGGRQYFADLVCLKSDLRWLFATMAADVILRIEERPTADPVALTRACLGAWRGLFASGGRPLSPKQLAGLFGELVVLRRLLEHSPTALQTWRGPSRHYHDFVSGPFAIEVKTTLTSEDRIVHIHGLEQLEQPGGGALVLAHLRAESLTDDGTSVPEVVAQLAELVSSAKLKGLLAAAGYLEDHEENYRGLRFRLVEQAWYDVGDTFPRLSRNSFPGGQIPTGLADFQYTLDLTTVTEPPLSEAAVEDHVRRIAQP
jgi:hypothetical protein